MNTAFAETQRSIAADRSGRTLGLVAALVVVAWLVWLSQGRISVYESSDEAWIEAEGTAYSVQAPVAATVRDVRVTLGQRVEPGDVLVVLDAEALVVERTKFAAQRASLRARLQSLERSVEAHDAGLRHEQGALAAATAETKARVRGADALARSSRREAVRSSELARAGLLSPTESEEAQALAREREAVRDSTRTSVARIRSEGERDISDRVIDRERLSERISAVRGDMEANAAGLALLDLEIERHLVRATVGGVIGDLGRIDPSNRIGEGAYLLSIVPKSGAIRASARFSASTATGRLTPGQRARLRLDGFPWTQWGAVEAQVRQVATEPRDGTIEVIFDIDCNSTEIPVQHGQLGTIDVEVERLSPARLVLQAAAWPLHREPDR